MKYVDHEPAVWFLVEEDGVLYLDARYSSSAVIDDSALVRLWDSEVEAYLAGGRASSQRPRAAHPSQRALPRPLEVLRPQPVPRA